jgi:hypothetical protein
VAPRWDLYRLERQQPTLENVFLQYVKRTRAGRFMSGVLAVLEKELLTYFRSPIAYFVLAVFYVGTGYFFTYNIFLTGDATMNETFLNMGSLLVIVLPMLTMRLFAANTARGRWSYCRRCRSGRVTSCSESISAQRSFSCCSRSAR